MGDISTSSADLLVERELETKHGRWNEYLFRYAGSDIIVLAFGDWQGRPDVLVRVHSVCTAAQYLFSVECDCREQLDIAFKRIVNSGYGLVVLLDQDGRGNGHVASIRAASFARLSGCTQSEAYLALGYPSDSRLFIGAAIVLKKLGVLSVRLLTNNPDKIEALREKGISVVPERLIVESQEDLSRLDKYYVDKAREGHFISKWGKADKRL